MNALILFIAAGVCGYIVVHNKAEADDPWVWFFVVIAFMCFVAGCRNI